MTGYSDWKWLVLTSVCLTLFWGCTGVGRATMQLMEDGGAVPDDSFPGTAGEVAGEDFGWDHALDDSGPARYEDSGNDTYAREGYSGGDCGCVAGEVEQRSCGNCGSEVRECEADCHWGGWGECMGQGPCGPGTVEEKACSDCGIQVKVCDDDCNWGPWSPCGPDGGCQIGATEEQECGNCGLRVKMCIGDCTWGEWSKCTGEGECAPDSL